MGQQQLHTELPDQREELIHCADCILHRTHHAVGEECIEEITKVARAWYKDMPEMPFTDYYMTLYEQALLEELANVG